MRSRYVASFIYVRDTADERYGFTCLADRGAALALWSICRLTIHWSTTPSAYTYLGTYIFTLSSTDQDHQLCIIFDLGGGGCLLYKHIYTSSKQLGKWTASPGFRLCTVQVHLYVGYTHMYINIWKLRSELPILPLLPSLHPPARLSGGASHQLLCISSLFFLDPKVLGARQFLHNPDN